MNSAGSSYFTSKVFLGATVLTAPTGCIISVHLIGDLNCLALAQLVEVNRIQNVECCHGQAITDSLCAVPLFHLVLLSIM